MKTAASFAVIFVAALGFARFDTSLREQAAAAVGKFDPNASWVMQGIHLVHSTDQQFTMTFDGKYRYKMSATGALPESFGFDGKNAWAFGPSGVPHISSRTDRDFSRLQAYVITGLWTAPDAPVEIVPDKVKKDLQCIVRCKDGATSVTLTLDPATHMVKTMASWGPDGEDVWTFSEYKTVDKVTFPTVAERKGGGPREKITLSKISSAVKPPADTYDMPKIDTTGFSFDPAASPDIEVKRLFGYLFIKPKINGADEGWWFLDTGADVMVIDPTIAKKYNATVVGKESVAGVVASVDSDFYKGLEFSLGPVTMKNSSYMSLDLSDFSKALGLKLAGICGYDFISRVSLDIDPKKSTIGVHAPGKAPLPSGAKWQPFIFHGNNPILAANFEGDRFGYFSLDTGSGATVDFFSPAVVKFDLLKGRNVTRTMTGGAGGASESRAGIIDWFQLGSKRFEKPRVGFQITTKGGFASPYMDGNIGMAFMGKMHMIFDYQNSRLSFFEEK